MVLNGRVAGKLGLALALMAPRGESMTLLAQGPATEAPNHAAPSQTPVPDTDIARKKGDLSKKLNSTSGVIHPEGNVDPAMRKPAPKVGATPVLPPPGSPGGNPNVQPK